MTSFIATRLSPYHGTECMLRRLENMTCELCPITVKKALDKVPGVAATKIDLGMKTATVKFDSDRANVATLVKATTIAGHPSIVHGRK